MASQLEIQKNKHALETDTHLRLLGTPLGDVYCIGDCATVQNNIAGNIYTFLKQVAWETGKDPETCHLDFPMWRSVAGIFPPKLDFFSFSLHRVVWIEVN